MNKNLSKFITNLWEKSAEKKRLTFFEKIFFLILCFFEKFYCIIFFIAQTFGKKNGNKNVPNLNIISVGNLSVGGTGKSVFVGFLVQIWGNARCAIISRGYGGSHSGDKSFLVSDGKNYFCNPGVCGDEPYMLANSLHVPVIIGTDRYKSCLLLRETFGLFKSFAILDDGYQNHQLKKDFEIVLVDARSPFGNGHCLPAGNLREKDYSRADVIILTHADEVGSEKILQTKTKLLSKFDQSKILCGKHKSVGIFLFDEQQIQLHDYKNKKFLVLAAVGSFSGFTESLKNFGIQIDQILQFPDHHNYSEEDVSLIFDSVKKHGLSGVITTQKDWTKLSFLMGKDKNKLAVFVFRVTFEFLTKDEELLFKKYLNI
ncbi:MAG: tetraacyldisaccharide 4'-kinase [bacterium]